MQLMLGRPREKAGQPATTTCGPFYKHCLTLKPGWISNHIFSKALDEITYPFPNFNQSINQPIDCSTNQPANHDNTRSNTESRKTKKLSTTPHTSLDPFIFCLATCREKGALVNYPKRCQGNKPLSRWLLSLNLAFPWCRHAPLHIETDSTGCLNSPWIMKRIWLTTTIFALLIHMYIYIYTYLYIYIHTYIWKLGHRYQ